MGEYMVAKQDSGIPAPRILITFKKNTPTFTFTSNHDPEEQTITFILIMQDHWFYVQMSEAKDAWIVVFSHKFCPIDLLLLCISNIGMLTEEPSAAVEV